MAKLNKEFIVSKGWECIDPDHMNMTYKIYHNLQIKDHGLVVFDSLLFMRVRPNYKGGTGVSILGYDVQTMGEARLIEFEPTPTKQYIFKGWIETEQEFSTLMKQLRI